MSLKLVSWNVNGLRSVIRKGTFLPFVQKEQPDILCIQETKSIQGQAEIDLPQYEEFWNGAQKKGYAGTVVFSRHKPLAVTYNIPGMEENRFKDAFGNTLTEGRMITAEYEQFYLVNVYTPNAKRDLARLGMRHRVWDPEFLQYVCLLQKTKPVVICGDLNVAHREIDIARPKANRRHAGFTDEEREGIDHLLAAGFVDTFRHFYPNQGGAYTWWSALTGARARNVGWRIDYFFVSANLVPHLESASIHNKILGSDHCPVEIVLGF